MARSRRFVSGWAGRACRTYLAGLAGLVAAALVTGCVRHHTLSVQSSTLLPKLVDIDRRGTATVAATDEIEGPYPTQSRAVRVKLTGADTIPLPEGPVRLDVMARRCLDPSPALAGPDPCVLRHRREDIFVVRRTTDRIVRPVVYGTLLGLTLGGLAFGGACLAGVCDGAPTVKHTGEIVGGVALTATIGVFTWALVRCFVSAPGTCRD